MTIIKQTAVNGKGHQRNLRRYINDDRKVLIRDSQNMEGCIDIKCWASYMETTRDGFGHNRAARRVRDKETGEMVDAKNTIMYHQILAFLPDECDINGGKLAPEDCMRYAKEYARTYYPNQQVVFALHNEYCKGDKTHRYAVHMVVNRSDISTGKRLNEGRGETAKRARASRVRKMDATWGLKQVEEGKENSAIHKKQPSKVEREIELRGGKSYKTNLRELCRIAARRAENIFEYRELLEGWGVDTQFRNGRMYATDTDNARYSFSVTKLDAALSPERLEKTFRTNAVESIRAKGREALARRQEAAAEKARVQSVKERYLSEVKDAYLAYRKTAREMEGTELKDFPKFRHQKPPEEIAGDSEVKRTVLAYWRGADELRVKMASAVPYARKTSGKAGGSGTQPSRPVRESGRESQSREAGSKGKGR